MVLTAGLMALAGSGPRVSDVEFYNALDLDMPGLEQVSKAANAKDYDKAGKALAAYYRNRQTPLWFVSWRDRPAPKKTPGVRIIRDAEEVMAHRLTSVGVKHQFGPRIDWSANPMKNKYKEWTWQLSRHDCWEKLRIAYWHTGDDKYAAEFAKQMIGWVEDNPPPSDWGNYPGSRWRTIEAGIRNMSSWPNCFFGFLGSPSFDDSAIVIMLKSFYDHAVHLKKYPTKGNWLCMEMCGLYNIGVLFPEFRDAEKWRDFALKTLYAEMEIQVYPDGAQTELAPGYHGVSLGCFEKVLETAKLNKLPVPGDYMKRIEKMYDYYVKFSKPNRCMPELNDSGKGSVVRFVGRGATYFPENEHFKYIASKGKKGVEPPYRSVLFPYAGWVVMRSDWSEDARYMLFDVGPFGTGHQHEDKLSILIHAYGSDLLSEGGIYEYDNSIWRKYVLLTYAHNTAVVDGLSQARGGNTELYRTEKPLKSNLIVDGDMEYAWGIYKDGYGYNEHTQVTHFRSVTFVKGRFWVLADVFTPGDDATHTYTSIFHFDTPEAVVDKKSKTVRSNNQEKANLAIIPVIPEGLGLEVVTGENKNGMPQGWIREKPYKMRPVATPMFSRTTAGVCTEVYILYPLKAGEDNPIDKATFSNRTVDIKLKNGESFKIRPLLEPKE